MLGVFVLLVGCRVHEYVVTGDEVPLYSTPALDGVVARMPLGHHEAIEKTTDGAALKVRFGAREGWARKKDVKELSYLDPTLDGGADREQTVGAAVREALASKTGQEWPAPVRAAVRDGRVAEGMTREQVELAWGWPASIEPLSVPAGGERWVWKHRGYEYPELGDRSFRPIYVPDPWARERYYRLAAIELRYVEFADGRVTRTYVRHYYDCDRSED